jgi:hypothetical protein
LRRFHQKNYYFGVKLSNLYENRIFMKISHVRQL